MENKKIEPIYKSNCLTCQRAWEDPEEKYRCPKLEQHWIDYELQQQK